MSEVMHDTSYIVLMMHKPYDENDKGFYEQLYAALEHPIVATIHNQDDTSQEKLKHMIEDAVDGKKGVVPVLVYQDTGWNEDLSVSLSDLVDVASIASLATSNPAIVVTYDINHKKKHKKGDQVIYEFEV